MSNLYEQIIMYIEYIIREKKLNPGDKLPSIRNISDRFNCSKSTVLKAYKELENKHIIYSVKKSGYYLVKKHESPKALNNTIIDFSSAAPDSILLPYLELQHCLNLAIDQYKENLFSYNTPQGLPSFAKVIKKQLQDYQVFTSTDNIFVTSGSQQALNLLSRMPFPNGKKNILVEQPTYSILLDLLKLNNITTLGIRRTSKGIDFDELERIFRNGNIKFFYTIPRFHNPTGFSYSKEEKIQILKLAQKYDVFIIEDDYLADLDFNSKADPIFSFDTTSRVIYIKSYSKILMPGLRIGIVVLPTLLTNSFLRFKKCSDLNSSILSQASLEIFIKSGMFQSHIKNVKRYYHEKMQSLKTSFNDFTSDLITCNFSDTGFFAWCHLPPYISSELFKNRLQTKNILISDSKNFYLDDFNDENFFRLSVCKVDKKQIEVGLKEIFEEVKFLRNIQKNNEKGHFIL